MFSRIAPQRRFDVAVVLSCLVVKLVGLFLDSHVRLFMGDSATYLWSAVSLGVPTDRSFSYPLLIRATAGTFGSIRVLLWVQTACGIATAWMTARLLRDACRVQPGIAAAAALLIALDPSQLFYERMVMTESVSTCVLIASLCAAFAFVRGGRSASLAGCIALGVLSVSLRAGLAPFALLLGPVCALLYAIKQPSRVAWGHVAFAILGTIACHVAYQQSYGFWMKSDPGYLRDAGLFRLGLVAPLVRAEDFAGSDVDASLLDEVKLPLSDPRQREAQIWQKNGLIDVLKRRAGPLAYHAASIIAANAIHRDPLALLDLSIATTRDYFDPAIRAARLYSDLGSGQLPDDRTIALLRTRFDDDDTDIARVVSPIYSYFAASWAWPVFGLFMLAPLALAAAWCGRRMMTRPIALLLALACVGLVIGHLLCAHIVSFRYLHPFPVLMAISEAVCVDAALAQPTARRVWARLRIGQQRRRPGRIQPRAARTNRAA